MAYYYIQASGTATGDAGRAATKRTGTFAAMGASAYYSDLADLLAEVTTAPTAGDYICIASDYSVVNATIAAGYAGTLLISVDVSNADVYLKGAAFIPSDYNNQAAGNSVIGISVRAADDMDYGSGGQVVSYIDCDVGTTSSGGGDPMECGHSTSEKTRTIFDRCEFDISDGAGSELTVRDGGHVTIIEGTTVAALALSPAFYIKGSGVLNIRDTDLTDWIAASGYLLRDLAVLNTAEVHLHNCKLPQGLQLFSIATVGEWWEITMLNCSNPNATVDHDAMYYFQYDNPFGNAEADIDNYLAATYDGSKGLSAKIVTTAECSISKVFRTKIETLAAQDLTSNTTYTVNFVSEDAINKNELYLEVVRPDATDQVLGIIDTTRPADLFTTAAAHDTNTETWTETYTTPVKQEESVTITGMTGVDNATVEVYVCIADPSLTVNVDIAVVVS